MTINPPLQEKKTIELDANFSTTRRVTMERPAIINDSSAKVQSHLFLPPNPERKGEGGLRTKGYFKHSYTETSELSEKFAVPLVTIITVVFNGEKHLEQAIQSVISQSYNNVEYIIIDGGSTDSTIDIIRKYDDQIDYWLSEPDEGIYDAMNKGWKLSQGDYIYYLGSDDILLNIPSQSLQKASLNNTDIIYGNVIMDNGQLRISRYNPLIVLKNTLCPQGLFIKKNLLAQLPFNTKYKIYADFDLNQKIYKMSASSIKDKSTIAFFRLGGASSSYQDNSKLANCKQEYARVIYDNFGLCGLILSWIWGAVRGLVVRNNIHLHTDYKTLKKVLKDCE
ncbi:MAG: glycosyltransferase [Microcystis aeruginosa W13-18]|nr:glycosyltransferase [Microcystis aeruginosa W13-18]NCR34508.1 glycosyltransferase [Microcystis aeruginosa S11-05]NCR47967.1 glycosyltransferase [Microcystis aeruginosa S11-01]